MADDLELHEDMHFQEREWRFQRVGWIFLTVIVIAALAGLLGSGPLSHTMVEGGMLRIDFDKFAHREASTTIDVTYRHKQGDTSLVLEFDRECLEGGDLEGSRPGPKSTMAREGEGLSYEFDLAPGAEWSKFRFLFKPAKAGFRRCKVMAEGLASLEFNQFIYP